MCEAPESIPTASVPLPIDAVDAAADTINNNSNGWDFPDSLRLRNSEAQGGPSTRSPSLGVEGALGS